MSAKQDMQGARTPADLERKWNFGKTFAEITGIAEDSRKATQEVKEMVELLDKNLTSEEIFNRLTENGTKQGVFTYDNGEVYINAKYIKSLEALFANNIAMTGKFTNTGTAFIEPGAEEVETVRQHLFGNVIIPDGLIPSYDTNNDGKITLSDLANMQSAYLGKISLANMTSAKKSTVTLTIDLSNPEKLLRVKGKNMWGREVDSYIGINFTSIKNPEMSQQLNDISEELTKVKEHLGI